MKIEHPKKPALYYSLVLICVLGAATGCFWKGDEVKFPKASDPEAAAASCAQSQGFDEQVTKRLTQAFKDYDGEVNDEFKLAASTIITESDSVPATQRNSVMKEYFSCLAGPSEKK
jgi:hypothetical protein